MSLNALHHLHPLRTQAHSTSDHTSILFSPCTLVKFRSMVNTWSAWSHIVGCCIAVATCRACSECPYLSLPRTKVEVSKHGQHLVSVVAHRGVLHCCGHVSHMSILIIVSHESRWSCLQRAAHSTAICTLTSHHLALQYIVIWQLTCITPNHNRHPHHTW
jgi:hypothetical protein